LRSVNRVESGAASYSNAKAESSASQFDLARAIVREIIIEIVTASRKNLALNIVNHLQTRNNREGYSADANKALSFAVSPHHAENKRV
jgi:hypothetical protein